MILIRLGTWSSLSGKYLIWDRLYKYGWKWSPFCRVRLRYYRHPFDFNNANKSKIPKEPI